VKEQHLAIENLQDKIVKIQEKLRDQTPRKFSPHLKHQLIKSFLLLRAEN